MGIKYLFAMFVKRFLILSAMAAFLFTACGPSYKISANKNLAAAELNREAALKVSGGEEWIKNGESLLSAAKSSLKEGKEGDADSQSEQAALNFQIAIHDAEVRALRAKLEKLESALTVDQQHLSAIRDVYQEIKTLRKQ